MEYFITLTCLTSDRKERVYEQSFQKPVNIVPCGGCTYSSMCHTGGSSKRGTQVFYSSGLQFHRVYCDWPKYSYEFQLCSPVSF